MQDIEMKSKPILIMVMAAVLLSGCITIKDGEQGSPEFRKQLKSGNYPNTSLKDAVEYFGYPAFYDYYETEQRIILYYIAEYTEIIHILAPFYIDVNKNYQTYYFYFEIDNDDIYNSKLEKAGHIVMLGKHYHAGPQIPLGIFLQSLQAETRE
jgi:hypothetical protein